VTTDSVTSHAGVLTSGPDADNPGGDADLDSPPGLHVARGTDNALWIFHFQTRTWRSLGGTVT
jgi:hypothetical protein